MGLINTLSIVLILLASAATCQVVHPEGHAGNEEFPYLVHIDVEYNFPAQFINERFFYGGGVIVNNKWIVTCAHNFNVKERGGEYYPPHAVTVLAGTKNTSDSTYAQEETVNFDNVIVHGGWRNGETVTDIALIFLGAEALEFNERVQPARLIAAGRELAIHSKCRIVGWGKYIGEGGEEDQPEAARKGSVYVVESDNCERCINEGNKYEIFDRNHHICIGCKGCKGCSMVSPGDSGSPVVQLIGGFEVVVGLLSSGSDHGITRECGKDKPGAAVKISAFRKWMRKKMREREERYRGEVGRREQAQRNMAAAAVASVAAAYFVNRVFR